MIKLIKFTFKKEKYLTNFLITIHRNMANDNNKKKLFWKSNNKFISPLDGLCRSVEPPQINQGSSPTT